MAMKKDSPLERVRKIGQGGFGTVYFGYYRKNEVAIKDIAGRLSNEAMREAEILKRLRHPNIIRYIDIIVGSNQISLVMDFIDKDNLRHYIENTVASNAYWKTTTKILLDIAQGMAYLHDQNVVHADLKSLNVLLRHNYEAVICDFGLATAIADSVTQYTENARGTVRWFAPELCIIPPERSSYASDIWAFGCVILEVTSQKIPWIEDFPSMQENVLIVALGQAKNATHFKNICRAQKGPEELRNLLCRCCAWEKSKRPKFNTIVTELSSLVKSEREEPVRPAETDLVNSTKPQPQPKPKPKRPPKSETQSLPSVETARWALGLPHRYPPDSLEAQFREVLSNRGYSGCKLEEDEDPLEEALFPKRDHKPQEHPKSDTKYFDPVNRRNVFQGPGGGYYYLNDQGKKNYIKPEKIPELKLFRI